MQFVASSLVDVSLCRRTATAWGYSMNFGNVMETRRVWGVSASRSNGTGDDMLEMSADARSLSTLVESDRRRPILAGSTAERWALLILRVLDAASDPKTLDIWARAVNVSRTALCECCRLLRISPHDARDFARLLRAISRSASVWQPEAVMDIADARTLRKLLERAGLADARTVPTFDEFFDRQMLIPRTNPGLIALREMLTGL
jgi:hypothetical protein